MPTIYNYPYYPEHMEKLGGWVKDNDYVEYYLPMPDAVPEKFMKARQSHREALQPSCEKSHA